MSFPIRFLLITAAIFVAAYLLYIFLHMTGLTTGMETSITHEAGAADCSQREDVVVHVDETTGPVSVPISDCHVLTASVVQGTNDELIAPVPVATPESEDGPFAGLFDVVTAGAGVPGANTCYYHVAITEVGQVIYEMDVQSVFTIAPFSNLTDWYDYRDIHITPFGSALGWHVDAEDGGIHPYAYFSPGIVSVLWQYAMGRFASGYGGTSFVEDTLRLNGWIYSPAVIGAGDVCNGDWTYESHGIIPGAGSLPVPNVGDWCDLTPYICYGAPIPQWPTW